MRLNARAELQRVDLGPLSDLLPALREEWAALAFDASGRLLNPLTGEVDHTVQLTSGRHRQVGAVYRIKLTSPRLDLPDHREVEFAREARRLTRSGAKQEQWDDHFLRRREASVRVGVDEQLLSVTLEEDSSRRLAGSVSEEGAPWAVRLELDDRRWPTVHLDGEVDLTAVMREEGAPGCVAASFGGIAQMTARLDSGCLDGGGRVLEVEGQARRFRGRLHLDLDITSELMVADGAAVLRGRGLGRLVLWFVGGSLRKGGDRSLKAFFGTAAEKARDLQEQMLRLRARVLREGGEAEFVRRFLWDESFDRSL